MLKYVLRRLLVSLLTLAVITTIIFLLVRLLPGDPARMMAGDRATAEDVENLRAQLGLHRSVPEQFWIFIQGLSRGDLGKSLRTEQPVLAEIGARLPATMELAVIAILLASLIGVPVGLLAAIKRYTWFDMVTSVLTLFGVAMPVYWLGLMLMMIFAVQLQWLPALGRDEGLRSLVLPSVTLAMFSLALITRMTRATTMDILAQDYITTARAKGLKERLVLLRHVLRNAMIPVVTVVGLQFGSLLGGAILTETIFAWPGLGRMLTESLSTRDYPLVQGVVIVFAAMFILVNLAVDLLYGAIDPRIHYD